MFGWLALTALGASFQALLDPATIYAGQATTLSLEFEGGEPDNDPKLPRVPGLSFGGSSREQRINFVNGRQSSSLALKYFVNPAQPGRYIIPAFSVRVGGQTLTSKPLQLTVLPANSRAAPGTSGAQIPRALLRIEVPRTNVFVGELLPVELALYAINPRQYELGQLPADGCTVGKTERMNTGRVPMNGVLYTRAGTRTTVVPNRAGSLQLGPLKGRVEVLVQTPRRRTGDPFEDFFNDPFLNRSSEVADVTADAVPIHVLSLPTQNVPPGFTGAVGDYSLELSAAPTNVAVGDPVHLRIQISGKGALDSLTLPSLDAWKGFRVYPSVSRVETTDTLGTQGSKIFEQDIVAENTEVKAIPALTFSFFDPVNAVYVSLTNRPIPLLVRPAGGSRGLAATAEAGGPPPKEIVHIKPRPGVLALVAPPLVSRPWFWVLPTAPLLAWLAVWYGRKRREHLAAHPRLVRRQMVARLVRAGVADLARHAADGNAAEVFVITFRLLQEQLGERLDLPAASITEAVVDEHLKPLALPEELIEEVRALFQACNQARYAPAGSVQDLQNLAGRVQRTLGELQKIQV